MRYNRRQSESQKETRFMPARKFARNLFALLLALSAATSCAAGAEYIQERAGAPLAFRKFFDSQKTAAYTKITFFGRRRHGLVAGGVPDRHRRTLRRGGPGARRVRRR
jgi:hypothetical protein